ncbi:amidohydrolase 2 [gut metagenome]|uniref:6-methylsalicylate decarboxylase n=1 Tax=gut metagenome TaxID=749906 RepID=J9D1V0_9ZZZZ
METLNRHNAAMDEGFPIPDWDIDSHIKFMKSAGIGKSILTMPAPQPFFGDTNECIETIRQFNRYCAKLKQEMPDKFGFCASLPLPDVDAAITEAIYALDTLNADGVKLATNSRGLYIGDKELDPLMELLNKRKAVIILHPHKPVPINEKLMTTLPLAAYEYLAETTRAEDVN